jgi:hypothetical protein
MGRDRRKRRSITENEAARRIEELRRVFDQGFITRSEFENMKRQLETRVNRTRS